MTFFPQNWSWWRYLTCRIFHHGMTNVTDKYRSKDAAKNTIDLQCECCKRVYWWHV